ncbi:voltage dependent t type calcium channel subunit [Trichuris trichiura]|uniref:Voltage-dependent T-type calcium channel subunit alpha n=1 Tax=Trichuris trichiura TaxID=36087 RepID=A0A077Z3K4_TRITR|nr:voltage dependent t type calcium channel subunit [Trichuris trichiura]
MLEGPPPAEYRSFRSLSRANRASICRKSRSSIVAPPSPTSKRRQSSGSPSVDGGKKSSPFVVPEVVNSQTQSTPPVGAETAPARNNGSDSLARDLLSTNGEEENDSGLPYPSYSAKALLCLDQRTPPRSWCLRIVSNPYPFSSKRSRFFFEPFCHANRLQGKCICFLNSLFTWFEKVSMMVILINCVTLGMYRPCDEDNVATSCTTVRCKILTTIDHMVFAFFAIEMVMKIIALGFYGGDQAYLSETWNRLDFFIVIAGCAEYIFKDQMGDINLTAIRTVRVLRPLRAINRIPSMRILVNLLLDTLPMLGNVLLLCFFVFFIFGIVGVQLWAGLLRNRCLLNLPPTNDTNRELLGLMQYYMPDETSMEYICSLEKDHGRHSCTNLQPSTYNGHICNLTIDHWRSGSYSPQNNSCINWNQYYTKCGPTSHNPFQGSVSFDNIGYAWVSIYLVISLEGWSDIMYYVQDAHSFWDWVYFVLLIVIGAFFMINLCLVVIATQFAETKRRETERMMAERALYYSSSTLATIDQPSESDGVYRAIVKYIAHLGRRAKRKAMRYYRSYWQKSSDHSPASLRELPIAYASSAEPTTVALPPKRSSIRRKRSMRQSAGRPSLANELALPSSRDSLSPSHCFSVPGAAASSRDSSSLSFFSAIDDSIVGPSETGSCPPAFMHRKRCNSRRSNSRGKRLSDNSVMSTETMASRLQTGDTLLAVRKPRKHYKLKHTESAPGGRTRADVQGRLLVNEPFLESGHSPGSEEDDDDRTIFSEDEADGEQEDDEEEQDDNGGNDGASAVAMKTFDTEKGRERVKFADKRRSQFDGSARSRKSRLCHFVQRLQNRVKRFVDGDHFTRGILVAILVNTLSMGIEYHNQPEELTLVLEYSNILFTALFAVEMLLKLIAEGPIVELIQGGNGGLSVLRTFRLLRILKLVRFMPALRYQLIVMLRTMDNVTVFFGLLCLFIFIFSGRWHVYWFYSILGMNLFGCKFCRQEEAPDGTQVRLCDRKNFDSLFWATLTVFQVCILITLLLLGMELFAGRFCHTVDGLPCPCKMKEVTCVCSRRNFDTFIQAAFTVFQILTQEDWNVVLFNGMAQTSPWAALYFIALMTFGNYVLFNLLVAILVEGFQESKEEEKRLLQEQQQDEISGDICEPKKLPATETAVDRPLLTCTCAAAAAAAAAAAILSGKHRERLLSLPALPMQFSCSDVGLAPPPIIQTLPTPADSPLLGRSVHTADKSSESLSSNQENGHLKMDPNLSSYSSISIKSNSPRACTPQDGSSKRPCRNSMTYLGIPAYPSAHRKLQRHWSSVSSPTKPETIPEIGYSLSCEDNFKSLAASNPDERSSLAVPGALVAQCNGGLSATALPSLNGKRNSWLLKRDIPLSPMHSAKVGIPVPDSYSVEAISRSGLLMSDQFGTVGYLSHRLKKSPKSLLRSWFHGWFEKSWFNTRMDYSLFLFSLKSSVRVKCIFLCEQKWFDFFILTFIGINCVTLAMERPDIPPMSVERMFLDVSNYVFTAVFAVEMLIKVIAKGLVLGDKAYFKNGWDFMDGTLVIISFCNLLFDLLHRTDAPRIFSVVRVLRLLRALRPLRVINRAPGVKLVVQTLISSLKPIGNIVLICCTFFIIFGILGVQLFKGKMWHCVGPSVAHVVNKTDCLADPHNRWVNHRNCSSWLQQSMMRCKIFNLFSFKALMSLFVVASKDGWVSIMYQGIDAVAVDMQPVVNYFEWRMLYFISFLLLVGFFVLNMFVGVVVENFHRCKEALEKEMKEKEREKKMRKRLQKQMSRQQLLMKKAHKLPYWYHYGATRLYIHSIVTSKYFDLAISAVIGVNVITMAMEFHMMPAELSYTLKVFNYFFTVIFTLEAMVKIYALGIRHYLIDSSGSNKGLKPMFQNFGKHRHSLVMNTMSSRNAGAKGYTVFVKAIILNVCQPDVNASKMTISLWQHLYVQLNEISHYCTTGFNCSPCAVELFCSTQSGFRWNQLDVLIVILSISGIILEEMESKVLPINPTIMRVMRMLRIARILKLLKMAKGIRSLLDTVMQALPQVGNLGLLFFLLFFIFAALGVELFGRLECSDEHPCDGLGEHAHFKNFGIAFLTLFRIATGDNWNGIMKDTLRDDCDNSDHCATNCCVSAIIAPIYFVVFVLMAQFVLVNVVVAVLMKHLEESSKKMADGSSETGGSAATDSDAFMRSDTDDEKGPKFGIDLLEEFS